MRHYDVALLDLDGVVYVGPRAVPTARPALDEVRRAGMRLAFVTNNASRTPHAIVEQLLGLGVSASAADVVTSAQAAARMIAERVPPESAVLVVGGTGLRQAMRAHGLRPVTTAVDQPVAVAQGYSPDLTYDQFAEAALAVRAGALYVAANADVTLPSARGPMPGNGAFVEMIRAATGRGPVFAGKPESPLYREAMLRAGACHPLMVGDRLETDIEGASRVGADSLLVLTGVTDPLDLVLAPPARRPTYVARDLGGLLVPHPGVRREGDTWRCRGWTARWSGDRLEVGGHGDAADGLRVLCGAVWEAASQPDAVSVRAAIESVSRCL